VLHYAITSGAVDGEATANSCKKLVAQCGELAGQGVEFVLLREKQLAAGALAGLAREVVAEIAGRAKVLVAQRVDVALAVGAAGVHLSARMGELTPGQVRRLMPGAFVSVACHTVEELMRAREGGADAVLFGPMFGKTVDGVEVVAGVGLERLRAACEAAGEMTVFALGGVTEANAAACVEAGAAGVAGIRMFFRPTA
jgi:thiamine-phosphate pyrophosphorylase